jgi:DNA-binding LacI/PurR family transcriptional regulator
MEFADPTVANYLSNTETIIYNYRFDASDWDKRLIGRGHHLVGVNRLVSFRAIAQLLRELGHVSAYLPGVPEHHFAEDYRAKALEQEGIRPVACSAQAVGSLSSRSMGFAYAHDILKSMPAQKATAACFGDDEVAGFAMAELRRHGVRIPDDLTITGFDGLPLAQAFSVPLTTLQMPVEKMVACVLRILAGEPKGKRHCYDMELIYGQSHAKPSKLKQKKEVQ